MSADGTSKLRLKLGVIEVDCEGSESFIVNEIPKLVEAVVKLSKESGLPTLPQTPIQPQAPFTGTAQGTTGQIAAKIGCKSGTDLVLAASARLALVHGKDTFTRKEIVEEMKTASGYFKSTYVGNLTGYLNGLVKEGKLLEPSKDTYAVSATAKQNLVSSIAN